MGRAGGGLAARPRDGVFLGQLEVERLTLLPTLVMLKLMLKLCPSPSTCHTHTLQARSVVLALMRSKVKVQCRCCRLPFQM